MVKKSLQKLQSENNGDKYIGLQEIIQWSKVKDIDKCILAENLIKIASREKASVFRKALVKTICNDYCECFDP